MSGLAELSFSVQVAASRETVWNTVTEGYSQWIAAIVGEGAQTKGAWEKDSEVEFYPPGNKGGMVAQVVECEKLARIQWVYQAMIQGGERMSFADMGDKGAMFAGMGERYELSERDGGVFLEAAINCPEAQREFMQSKWSIAIAKIKELSEANKAAGND